MDLGSNGAASVAILERGGHPRARVPTDPEAGPAIPPLAISGPVVAKADLVAALRLYVPQFVDFSVLDAERFILSLRHGSYDTRERIRAMADCGCNHFPASGGNVTLDRKSVV